MICMYFVTWFSFYNFSWGPLVIQLKHCPVLPSLNKVDYYYYYRWYKDAKHFPCGIVFIIYILRHSSFWQPLYLKSFQNAKICRYTARNDKQNEATLVNIINEGEVQGLQVTLTFCSECTIENEWIQAKWPIWI